MNFYSMKISIKKITLRSAPFYINTILNYGLNFYWISLILKTFGIDDYGLFILITSIASLLLNVIEIKTNESTTFFLKKTNISQVITISMIFDLIIFLLFLLITFVLIFPIKQYYLIDYDVNLKLLFFGFIANLPLVFVSTTLGYLTFFEKFWTFNLLNLLPIIIKVILAFILPFNDLMDLFHIIFFANFVLSLVSIFYLLATIKFKFQINRQFSLTYFNYSYKNFFSTLLKSGHQNIEKLFLGFFLDVKFVGAYEIFIKIANFSSILVNPVSTILFPKFVKKLNTVNDIDFRKIFKISFLIFCISIITGLFVYVFKDFIFDILNFNISIFEDLSYIEWVFILILIHRCFLSSAWWVRILPLSIGRTDIPVYTNLFQFIYIPITCYFLIPQYGFISVPIIKIFEILIGIYLVWFVLNSSKQK
jgi:O-antigen/teichoic acid export membrane protein